MKKAFSIERLPVTAVILHTILIAVLIVLFLLPSSHADTSIGFYMMIITAYFIDLPIGILLEIVRPYLIESSLWPFIGFSVFIFLGGLYWFIIFTIIVKIVKLIKIVKSHNKRLHRIANKSGNR